MKLDLLIVNGHILDVFSGIDGYYSIGVKDGRILGIYPQGTILPESSEVLNLQGDYLSAGWIDLHTHVAVGHAAIGIDADTIGIQQGVTTVVDAGSAGCDTFADFEEHVIHKAQTRVLSWLNVSAAGLYQGTSELADLRNIHEEAVLQLIRRKPMIRGLKVRMSHSVVKDTGVQGLKLAKNLAQKLGLPVFVHIGNRPPVLTDVLELLGKGDVITHIFHGKPGGCLDDRENILPELHAALQKGIYLDLGHGTESCSFSRLRQARECGLSLDTISTDLYSQNYHGPVYSLAHTMEKCMALGMTLQEVLAAVTLKPSMVLGISYLGRLKVGAIADFTIFSLLQEEKEYKDSEGNTLCGRECIMVKGVVREGSVIRV
jgi:dihydroorotase